MIIKQLIDKCLW